MLRLARLTLVIAATLLSVRLKPDAQTNLPVLLCIGFLLAALLMFGGQARLRFRGGQPATQLGPENITLPRSALSLRSTIVPYVDVRSVTVSGRGPTAQLIIETSRRSWRFPVVNFIASDALWRLQEGLRQHATALPGGAARWDAIVARHQLAERIGAARPWGTWGTWGIILVALLCFAVQALLLNQAVLTASDGFAIVDAGANAALLVHGGQWFRLVAANLLHLNARHVLGNLLFVLAFGSYLEPLIGLRRLVLVMLWSCLASQLVSAAVGLQQAGYLFAIGNSGGVYGLAGGLAAVTLRFGVELPGGYRLPSRAWLLIGLSLVAGLSGLAFPSAVTRVDHAAHAGGFAAGLPACLLLLPRRRRLRDTGSPGLATNVALASVSCIWVAGIAAAALHAASPQALAADRYELAAGMLARDRFPSAVKNMVAWAVAAEPAAPTTALRNAQELARRGVMEESNARGPGTPTAIAVRDTEAVLSHRLGQDDKAIRLELPLLSADADAATHLADFLEASWRRRPLTTHGDTGPPPLLAIGDGVLILSRTTPVAVQTDVLALVHRNNAVAGLLRFQLVPGFVGKQLLPLPSSRGGPSLSPPPAIWTDGQSTIDITLLDADGCRCRWPTLVPAFYPYAKAAAVAP